MTTNKYLSLLIAFSAVFWGFAPAWGESDPATEVNFLCDYDESGITSTIAQNINGDLQPIFHWKDISPSYKESPQEICDLVTQRLNRYFAQGYNSLSFELSYSLEFAFPVVCLSQKESSCSAILLELPPNASTIGETKDLLETILDDNLQLNWIDKQDLYVLQVEIELFQ